jgi:hypothetical protein
MKDSDGIEISLKEIESTSNSLPEIFSPSLELFILKNAVETL